MSKRLPFLHLAGMASILIKWLSKIAFALYQADKKLHVDCSPLKEKSSEICNIVDMALLLSKSYLKSRMFDKTLCAVWPELIFTLCKSNAAVLVGKIEIAKLREFQAKTYELQKDDSTYKPTPPNFNSRIAYQKSTGQLSADIIKELFT